MRMLTDGQKQLIRRLRADGMTYDRISNITGHSVLTVHDAAWDVQKQRRGTDIYAQEQEAKEARRFFRKIKRKARYIQAQMQAGTLKPCEHCRWRMNKAPRPVCVVCYREVFGR